MTIERDELGFDAPAPLGHPGRLGLPDGHPTGPELLIDAPLHLTSMGIDLPVWSGLVDFVYPFHPTGELVSEVRPLDVDSVTLQVTVRYQACNDDVCLLPKTETLCLDVALDVIDMPALPMHRGHGQRQANFDARPHLRRLLLRKVRQNPIRFLGFLWKSIKLELAARRRGRQK